MNVNGLIGKLQIIRTYAENETQQRYLRDAVDLLENYQEEGLEPEYIAETAAALEMMSYRFCRREAEVLRDMVEFLESLDCEVEA